jgi:hypothetical protein
MTKSDYNDYDRAIEFAAKPANGYRNSSNVYTK